MASGAQRIVPCVIVVLRHGGELLLVHRVNEPYRGLWSFVGGKMHAGESVADCVKREVKEETGLECVFKAVHGVATEKVFDGDELAMHTVLFFCEAESQGRELGECDEGELRWVTQKDFSNYRETFIPSDVRMYDDFLSGPLRFREILSRKVGGKYVVERYF